jgi:rhodanese-related sulfurtransferase
MTAHWLQQIGWDVQVLDHAFAGRLLEPGSGSSPTVPHPAPPAIEPAEAARWLDEGAAAISLESSAAYRQAHPPGSVWSIRPRLDRLPEAVLRADRIVLFAEDEAAARLAAADIAELSVARLARVPGGAKAWARAGLPTTASPGDPPDEERIDYLFWNHDRHAGNHEAMRAYLRWETELPGEIARDGQSGFRLAAPA